MRIAIIGNSGSGKSTLASRLAARTGVPTLDLDTVAWETTHCGGATCGGRRERCAFLRCRARPWEAHKYPSKDEQDKRLAFLLSWVSDYYTRDGEMSLSAHRSCFSAYAGKRQELRQLPHLEPPSREVLSWIT